MKKNLLSVCIPTYNRANLLDETLKCVSKQTVKPYEVLIVDNASTDNTKDIVNRYKRYGFKYIQNKKNIGLLNNINKCITLAKGSHIIFLHSDDLVSPNWYESWTKVLNENYA